MNKNYDPFMMTRRRLLSRAGIGVGSLGLASVMNGNLLSQTPNLLSGRAKRVIYLFQSGAPSQFELLDHKPELEKLHGQELGSDFFEGQRQTGMTAGQKKQICRSIYKFNRHGNSGAEISEMLPHLATVADDLCIVRSMQTDAINHDPAITFFQTGFQQAGRPSMGAWVSYGLGSDNNELPNYVVMVSEGSGKRDSQSLYGRLWGNGFLPSAHQGVKFRGQGDPVLYLSNPKGIDQKQRREILNLSRALNEDHFEKVGDPETLARIKQAELAYQMQTSVPGLIDHTNEPEHIFQLYGEAARTPGTFAANCLLARKLAEQGVRFIQLYERGWDHHGAVNREMRKKIPQVDRPCAALIKDLKQRGLLEDTLVIWGGEFGRTSYSQHNRGKEYGRDHHPRCFSIWMAGGGIRPGVNYGRTDELGYNVIENGVHVHDLQATLLHCLGINHEEFTFRFKGRDFRLTDVHGKVVKDLLA